MKIKNMLKSRLSADFPLLVRMFFRLLPYQILLIVINAANGIVDGLFASNAIGTDAMSAIGLYTPMTHFLYALSIMMVGGSQLLYGKYLAGSRILSTAYLRWIFWFRSVCRHSLPWSWCSGC